MYVYKIKTNKYINKGGVKGEPWFSLKGFKDTTQLWFS
jgi:hypothetical protein